ncbi:hypothetical protein [Marinilactibacillus kalidii]|uniref:hypothetical protein n=1 Tax=Marinilactibacillus kalidii TaxID=2820274 RepID=UPI001ABEB7B5|nr:hypothetical protein [Marinilactibacillus kalidii]
MKNYDEYQKFLRYKYGSESFIIVLFLTFINFSVHLFSDRKWAENQSLEMMLLVFIAIIYSAVRMIYSGAYFKKKQNGPFIAITFALIGFCNLYLVFTSNFPIIENNILTYDVMKLVSSIFFLSLSLAYFVRTLVEKRLEKNDG